MGWIFHHYTKRSKEIRAGAVLRDFALQWATNLGAVITPLGAQFVASRKAIENDSNTKLRATCSQIYGAGIAYAN